MAYAIVKTGGKQYRVEEGQTLLVERLTADEGAPSPSSPLLLSGDKPVFDKDGLSKVKVEAKVRRAPARAEAHRLQVQAQAGLQAQDRAPSGAHPLGDHGDFEWLIRRVSAPAATGATARASASA